jgi:hypothetical protein
MPDKPKDPKPTYDDIVRDWGYDKMALFCDMVRPDQYIEREEDANLPSAFPTSGQDHTPEEHVPLSRLWNGISVASLPRRKSIWP